MTLLRHRCVRRLPRLVCLFMLGMLAATLQADDWPNWRGPNLDGVSAEANWNSTFGDQPKQLWSVDVGIGYAAVSVVGDRLYTAGWSKGHDHWLCLDVKTGETIWRHSYPSDQFANSHQGGPGTTPCVADGRVYTLNRKALMYCLDANTGKPIWQADLGQRYHVSPGSWGFTGSPIVIDGKLLIDVGKILALDPATGKEIWATRDYGAGYSTPKPFLVAKRKLLAAFPAAGLVILDLNTGQELAQRPWNTSYNVNAAMPIVRGNQIFISSGYNTGGALLALDNRGLTVVWNNRNMRNHMNSCVLLGDHLYGFDDGQLRCIDFATGQVAWSERGLGKGALTAADGKLLVMSERGELLIAPADPAGFAPTARVKLLGDRDCWVVPVLANGRLYCRAPSGKLVCLDVSK